MIHVKRPRLLGSDLKEIAALHPLGLQLSLQTPGVSTATLTLSPDDAEPGMHDWIELYNQLGSVGVYRVTNPVTDFNQQLTLTLRHGIDCLADAVLEAQEDYKGAPEALLTRLLNAQKTLVNGVKPWVLGTCAATDDIDVNINYPRLSELLNTIEGQLEGYLITYDQTVFPWVLSVIEKPSTVDAEFRLNRNVQTLSRTLNDNEMCTQLILSINSKTVKAGVTGTDTIIKTYDNAEAQQRWGIIQKTADIDTSDTLTGDNVTTPEADAWAARFLRDHAAPSVQMQITGYELSRITGDTWDETKLGHICRVAVPKYNQSFDERIVAITYPDALGQPDSVTVSLANQLPKFSSAIASLKKEAARAGGAARKAGRDKADADEMQTWSQTVQYYGLALDGTGVMTLYESGIDMNPVGGVTIYSLEEGLQALYGGIQVNSNKIALVVTGSGGQYEINTAEIVLGINSQDKTSSSYVDISADYINLSGYVTATALDARLINADALFTTTGYAGTIYATNVSTTSTVSGVTGDYTNVYARNYYVVDAGGNTDYQLGNAVTSFGSTSASGGTITIPYYTSAHPSGTPAGNITFNIADTAYYQSHIGISSTGSWAWDYDETEYYRTITPNAGASVDVKLPTITVSAGSWSGSSCPVTVYGPNNHVITSTTVSASSIVGISSVTLNGPSTTAYSSGTDQGTLTADRYYQVAATPNSGSTVYIKFKTPSGGTSYNYTPDDIRLGNVSYYASMASGGTEWSTLASSIHANKGKSGYVRFTADLDGYTGTSKKYYIPMSGI